MGQILPSPQPGRHLTGKVKDYSTLSGNIIEIVIRGRSVGRCRSMRVQYGNATQRIGELGSILPAEHIPNEWTCRITVSKYRLRRRDFDNLPVAFSEEILLQELFDVVVRNKADGTVIETFTGCQQDSGSRDYSAGAPVNEEATFMVMDHFEGASASPTTAS